ncbi:MAG: hypothetical protein A2744_03445 [Candidatus Buchananbacteria bacterium RIFCSPHIGHO2_01_FULL_44_11]|uniref:Pseudouridine synthase n=1 Tax=Candidatus Buchananbacteria bacterium RIFCSPHIGHO2_01_FULL_44_11 TaxID=1797535 RepID=A0A1G1Y2B9_9BACT|nr:MAG: hypothetical protein A2744_03445 [Candidatus Buchananbacteria bacterium RIFCSPHIGHO2_01_FULL_44_11]
MMRLQKFLANAGITSRRKAETLIQSGKIEVNGSIVRDLGTKIDENSDTVKFANRIVKLESDKIYIALNKPTGYISSTDSQQGKTILDIIKVKNRVYPVGRLDKDSSGLIILTNDGEFANLITHARYGCQKEYFVTLDQDLRSEHIKILEKGMILAGRKLQPVRVTAAQNKSARMVLSEGLNRQIRRMLGKLGYTVIKLKRIKIGKLELADLEPGQWRHIKPENVI